MTVIVGKNFVPQLIRTTTVLCQYFTRHNAKILVTIQPLLSPADYAAVAAAFVALQTACDILNSIKNSV
jgi:hypothetical protein